MTFCLPNIVRVHRLVAVGVTDQRVHTHGYVGRSLVKTERDGDLLNIGDASQLNCHGVGVKDETACDRTDSARDQRLTAYDGIVEENDKSVVATTVAAFHSGCRGKRQLYVERAARAVLLARDDTRSCKTVVWYFPL